MFTRFTRIITGMHHVVWTFPDQVLVQRIPIASWLRALLPVQTKRYPWPQAMDLPQAISHVVHQIPAGRGDKWHLGLPLEYFTLVNFTLPQAARENLDQAVKYALMRHVPFDHSAIYKDYRLLGGNGDLEIAAVVAQKEEVDPVLQVFTQAGLVLRSMFPSLVFWAMASEDGAYLLHARGQTEIVLSQEGRIPFHLWFRPSAQEEEESFVHRGATLVENIPNRPDVLHIIGPGESELPDMDRLKSLFERTEERNTPPSLPVKLLTGAPYAVSLISAAGKKQEQVLRYLRLGSAIFLFLSLLAFPVADLYGTMRYLDRLESKVQAVQEQVQDLDAIRSENQELVQSLELLGQKVHSQPQAARILRELTEVMPETAWLYVFHLSDERVRIQGEAESATAVLEALENSPMFKEAQFDSPVQKSGSRDRFKIVAKVVV